MLFSLKARANLAAPAMLSPQPKSARCCHVFASQTAKFWKLKLRANNANETSYDETLANAIKCALLSKQKTLPCSAKELGAGFLFACFNSTSRKIASRLALQVHNGCQEGISS
jgi:hypothetical protein